jgi:hypothetical protein
MRLIGRAGRDGSDARLDGRLADIFDDRRTPGAPESLYAYVREVSMTEEEEPQAGRLTRMWRGLGRTGRIGVSLAAALVIVAGAVTAIGLSRGGLGGPGAASPSPGAVPSRPVAPSGWHFVAAVGMADDEGGLWTGAEFDPSGAGDPVLAVHVVCHGVDDLVVMLGTGPTADWTGRSMQSAMFRCDLDPSAGEGRVVFTAPDEPFTRMWAVIVRNPSSLAKNDWVVSLEAPDTSATPSPSPSSSPSPTP